VRIVGKRAPEAAIAWAETSAADARSAGRAWGAAVRRQAASRESSRREPVRAGRGSGYAEVKAGASLEKDHFRI